MLEIAAFLAALLPMVVLCHDDEIMVRVQLSPFDASSEIANSSGVEDMIVGRLRQEMTDIIIVGGSEHATMPKGMIQDSIAEIVAKLFHVEKEIHQLRMQFSDQNRELVLSILANEGKVRWKASLVRLEKGPITSIEEEFSPVDFDRAIHRTAKWAMRALDPLTLLNYEFALGRRSGSFAAAWEEVDACRRFYGGTYNPMVENMVGMIRLWELDPQAAGEAFRLAAQADPGFMEAKLNLALVQAIEEDRGSAYGLLDEVAGRGWWDIRDEDDAPRAAALALKSLVLDNEGKADAAVETVLEAVKADPDFAEVHEIAAAILRGYGHDGLANYHAQTAISLRTRQPEKLMDAFMDIARLRAFLPPANETFAERSTRSPG